MAMGVTVSFLFDLEPYLRKRRLQREQSAPRSDSATVDEEEQEDDDDDEGNPFPWRDLLYNVTLMKMLVESHRAYRCDVGPPTLLT